MNGCPGAACQSFSGHEKPRTSKLVKLHKVEKKTQSLGAGEKKVIPERENTIERRIWRVHKELALYRKPYQETDKRTRG